MGTTIDRCISTTVVFQCLCQKSLVSILSGISTGNFQEDQRPSAEEEDTPVLSAPVRFVEFSNEDSIRESVDSLCRDGSGPPIVCVHWKAVLTRERSCSKPFWTPSYPIRTFLYSMIPPK